ncbi:proto-oncogene tyrosine-protein kinase ROS-like [Camponotus floridanus]|uniref:proto-oncogene tyrosine-protein kinase ROS-like n=1 Tax=Camponotus floridanus TaxID=104421 RepID=UPI000DC68900|nr:proto-oncogene tyrosine-protein kinase ROS-like [Camponotus floridanus]
MEVIFGTIFCVLLKGLVLTKATITPNDYTTSNILQEKNISMRPELNFTQNISMSEKSDHHILNFKSDRSHSDGTVRNEREVDEVILANISITPESIENSLNKPTSLRAFIQFDSQFAEKVNDIFVTMRWNQPEFTDKIILGYQVQCSFFEGFKETCDETIAATKLEHTVHNLISNKTYYFRVRAYTKIVNKIVAGPYTDLINVSTTHENPIPKLLLTTDLDMKILDVDLRITNTLMSGSVTYAAYSIQEHRIYWLTEKDLMTLKINENNITKITSFDYYLNDLCIDWVARNLYFMYYDESAYSYIVKFDLTMWENGIIKFDEIFKSKNDIPCLSVSPSMGILYHVSHNSMNTEYRIMKHHLDGEIEQIVQMNVCLFDYIIDPFQNMIIDNMNNEVPLIYWLSDDYIFVTDINISMCNMILHNENISDIFIRFESMTIDKRNIYILASDFWDEFSLYVLKKKYASLKSVNAAEYVEKIIISSDNNRFYKIDAFDKSLQPYPPIKCLTPEKKVYNFKNVYAIANSIVVILPEPVVKSGCKKYNLPTTIYNISISCMRAVHNNLNKSEKFNVLRYVTFERYYKIQNLTPFTEYKLKFTLSNFYFDQLSINPFDSNVIPIKNNSDKFDAPENISVLALTPTIAVVHWMPLKNVNCVAVTYEVRWKSVTLVNGTQHKGKQFINVPKRTADGRFFTKINLSLPVQDYLIYVRVYPNNFSDFYNESLSDFYNESLSNFVHIYSEPNNITLSEVNINSMNISWISNINLTMFCTLEYKDIVAEKWQTMNYIKMNYNKEVTYHVENLQSGTLYMFRLILRYPEYEENFTWPTDERFIFSTLDIPSTPGIIENKYYLLLMLVIVPIICIFYIYRLYRQRRGNNEQFLSSTMTDVELAILPEVPCRNTQLNMIYSPMLHYNPDECAITKIARNQITLTKHLGSGAFGMVYQGKVKDLEKSGTEISVAIKTLPKDASSHEKEKLLKEAKLMSHFQHKHILRLLAVCLDGDFPLLVLELMEIGDLLKYLRECRNFQASDSSVLRLQDLLAMCEDVARGCCYLEELRFIHRDLACRNCLVSSRNRENRVIKIGDFGLARNIYKDDYYRVEGEGLFPIRWMAPESLIIRKFTSQSDVWSFGVLMWEITSLGEQPYSAKANEEVINYVRAGGRLPMTLNCPSPLYQMMLSCWSAADSRPNFEFCLKNIIALRKNIEDALLSPVDII